VASDGGIFSFDSPFYGSTGNIVLNKPVNGMTPTPDDQGYLFVASDGGAFAYGDAQFEGSMGGSALNAPVVGLAVDSATGGYWMVASDGGIFSFNAPFYGAD
jgi:ligand-binding sensor domain-containing protein